MSTDFKIYSSKNNPIFLKAYIQMIKELSKAYPLGLRLFKRDFSAKYRQSILGVLWVIIAPAFSVTVGPVGSLSVGRGLSQQHARRPICALQDRPCR